MSARRNCSVNLLTGGACFQWCEQSSSACQL